MVLMMMHHTMCSSIHLWAPLWHCRHIDCSSQYGSEKIIGDALEEIFSDWLVDRPDVFLTSRSTLMLLLLSANLQSAICPSAIRIKLERLVRLVRPWLASHLC